MAPEAYRTDPATWTCARLKNLRPTFGETVVVALAFVAPFGEVSVALCSDVSAQLAGKMAPKQLHANFHQ